jgi:ribosome maturation factor RimP
VLNIERTRVVILGQYVVGSPRADIVERIRTFADRVAKSHSLALFDVQFRRESHGWVLRVILDREPGAPADLQDRGPEGVTIEDCQRVSQDLGALLDVEADETLEQATGGRGYTLEVSSPGLDRPLRHEGDYRRFTGRLAKIVVSEPVDGQMHFAGRLEGVEDGVVLVAEGRRTHRVPLAQIARARLEVEF